MEFDREVDLEAAQLVRQGSAPYAAMQRAVENVLARRKKQYADKSGS